MRVDATNARSEEYREVLRKILAEGICPFCAPNFQKHHPNQVLESSDGWMITKVGWPYENTEHHFLLLNDQRHDTSLSQVSGRDFEAINRLVECVTGTLGIRGGALAARFGETLMTGATVQHLHFHFIVPQIDGESGRARVVYFPIG